MSSTNAVAMLSMADVRPNFSYLDRFDPKRIRVPSDDMIIIKSIRLITNSKSPTDDLVFVGELNPDCRLALVENYGWNSDIVYQEIYRQLLYASRDFSIYGDEFVGRGALGAIRVEKDAPRSSHAHTLPLVRYRILQKQSMISVKDPHSSSEKPRSVYLDSLGRQFRYQHVLEYIYSSSQSGDFNEVYAQEPVRMDGTTVVLSVDCRWLPSKIYDTYRSNARRSTLENLKLDAVLPPFQTMTPTSSYLPDIAISNQMFVYRRSAHHKAIIEPDRGHQPSLHNPHPLARESPLSDTPNLQVVTPRLNAIVDIYLQSTIDLHKTKLVFSEHVSTPIAWSLFEAALTEALHTLGLSFWAKSSRSKHPSAGWIFDNLQMTLRMHCEIDIPWAHRLTLYDTSRGANTLSSFRGTWELSHPGCPPCVLCSFELHKMSSESSSSKL